MPESQLSFRPSVVEIEFKPNGQLYPLAFTWQGQIQRIADLGRTWHVGGVQYWLAMTPTRAVFELRLFPDGRWQVRPISAQPVTV